MKKEEKNKTNITIVEDIIEYIKNSDNEKYLKITICDETKSIFNSVIRKLKTISDVNIEYFYTEISLKEVDKWTAIEYLMNELNIKKEEVIAIRR